jgi:hypothetical protein
LGAKTMRLKEYVNNIWNWEQGNDQWKHGNPKRNKTEAKQLCREPRMIVVLNFKLFLKNCLKLSEIKKTIVKTCFSFKWLIFSGIK